MKNLTNLIWWFLKSTGFNWVYLVCDLPWLASSNYASYRYNTTFQPSPNNFRFYFYACLYFCASSNNPPHSFSSYILLRLHFPVLSEFILTLLHFPQYIFPCPVDSTFSSHSNFTPLTLCWLDTLSGVHFFSICYFPII